MTYINIYIHLKSNMLNIYTWNLLVQRNEKTNETHVLYLKHFVRRSYNSQEKCINMLHIHFQTCTLKNSTMVLNTDLPILWCEKQKIVMLKRNVLFFIACIE